MKLYYTLNNGLEKSEIQLNMLELSLKSAKKNTNLDLYALYDGSENDTVYNILKKYSVKIFLCSCSFKESLQKYYNNNSQDIKHGLKRMLGCFMKFDISNYETEDNVVMYTDIDTIFMKNYDWDLFKTTKTILAAPEFNKNYDIIKNYYYFNAGILVINIPELIERKKILLNMLNNNIKPYQECWDQGFWNELYKNDFEKLPLEFNWKPYWGINKNAIIIHIHGIKLGSLTEEEKILIKNIANTYTSCFEGLLYYNIYAFNFLNINNNQFILNLIDTLNTYCPKYKKKEKFTTILFKIIYKLLYKYQNCFLIKNLYKYIFIKLHKRNPNNKIEDIL